jgi:transformation/transcription domain-associated protein
VYSSDAAIVQVSFDGLRDVIQQQSKLPKEVLQTGLRPILVNLADAKRLSVPGLDGLAKFLELLNNYFKVEIGIKLLDHFQSLSDEQTLNRAAQGPLEDNPDITRMSRLVNIFRLLPSSAVQFLVRLVGLVVDAEARLHQTAPGPFTEVLGKYLDRYHEEACTTLFENIRNPRYVWTYRNIIASGHAPQLIETLSNRCEDLVTACFGESDDVELVMPGLYLIRELTRADPAWLNTRQDVVLGPVVNVWRSILVKSRVTKENMSEAHYSEMPALVLELFMGFLGQQQHIPLLSHVVEAFEIRSPFERSAVAFFLYQQVALQPSVEYRRELIEYFLTLYDHEDVSWSFKTNMLRLIINPTLRLYFADPDNDGSLVTSAFIQKVNESMWKPLAVPAAAKEREDALLIEVFSLTTLLIQHAHTKVDQSRKEVFKFAWMGINLLEPTVKLTAYVLTATFMQTYETPAKFIKLCWIGLLRLKESETRALYREALRVLATTLHKLDPPGQTGIPEWAQRVRGILIEEGQTPNQLVTVCELLVNHPDLFYEYRELYVPHIANSLSKLAFLQNNTPELKKLSVDAVELIFRWERRRIASVEAERMDVDGGSGRKRSSDTNEQGAVKKQRIDGAGTAVSASSGGGWGVPGQVRELMTAHLLRLVSQSSDPVGKGGLTKRALDLFKEILGPKGLPNVHVKLGFFQRPLAQVCSRWKRAEPVLISIGNQRRDLQYCRQFCRSHCCHCCQQRPEMGSIQPVDIVQAPRKGLDFGRSDTARHCRATHHFVVQGASGG